MSNKSNASLVEEAKAKLERDKFEFEREKFNLEIDFQKLKLESEDSLEKGKSISGVKAATIGAIIGLLGGLGGATITGILDLQSADKNSKALVEIERTRVDGELRLKGKEFETQLIFKAIDGVSREEAIRNLKFFVTAGFIVDTDNKISNMKIEQFPSRNSPTAKAVNNAIHATTRIQYFGNTGQTGYCTSVFLSPSYLLAPAFCDNNHRGGKHKFAAALSVGKNYVRLEKKWRDPNTGLSVLKLENPIPGNIQNVLNWVLIREPIVGESVFFASWATDGSEKFVRECNVTDAGIGKSELKYDCQTGQGTAGALIFAATDDAPLGVHLGTGGSGAFGAKLSHMLTDLKPYF